MNRRNFIRNILVAGAAFTVLPPASTYERIWKVQRPGFWSPLKDIPSGDGVFSWEQFQLMMNGFRVNTVEQWDDANSVSDLKLEYLIPI